MTPVEDEMRELLERFAEEKRELERDQENHIREMRIEVRNKLRDGNVPDHCRQCPDCIRAILMLKRIECPGAQRHVPSKWLD